jgi:hypothetical protein
MNLINQSKGGAMKILKALALLISIGGFLCAGLLILAAKQASNPDFPVAVSCGVLFTTLTCSIAALRSERSLKMG